METKKPKISIVTPSYNYGRFIERAIESVLVQGRSDVEHIVVDNFSTDETVEVVKKYPHIKLFQEKMNTPQATDFGAAQAKAEIVGFLNCDDYYEPDVFSEVIRLFEEDSDLEVVAGDYRMQFEDSTLLRTRGDDVLDLKMLCFGAPGFNAYFFKKSVFKKAGPFENPRCLIANDRDFFLRLAFLGAKNKPLGKASLTYRCHRDSKTLNNAESNRAVLHKQHLAMAKGLLPYAKTQKHKWMMHILYYYSLLRICQETKSLSPLFKPHEQV